MGSGNAEEPKPVANGADADSSQQPLIVVNGTTNNRPAEDPAAAGAGAPPRCKKILFVHGAWHGPWCWDVFVKYFSSQGYECHTLALRGHDQPGINQSDINRHSIGDYVRDVVAKVERIGGTEDLVLVGHSMGGLIVQKYLEQHTCAKAILLGSVPPSGVFASIMRFMQVWTLASLRSIFTLNAHVLVNSRQKAHWAFFSDDLPEDEVSRHAGKLCGESFLAFVNMLWAGVRVGPHHRDTPILVLGAREDRIFSVAQTRSLATRYNAPCHIFPDMAHNMMIDKSPLKVAEFMKEWMETGAVMAADEL